jgi:hypothetical protein
VFELSHIGCGAADVRREQLLVGGAPGDLLHLDVDAGILSLEVAHQLLHDLAFATHGPEPDRGSLARRAAGQ